MKMVKEGEPAPEFCLMNESDEKTCLKDYKGKWVVLYFYPEDMTSGCTIEAIDFTKFKKDFGSLGAEILGVSPDSTERHQKFIDKNDLKITLLSDTAHEALEKYGVWQDKKMYGKEFKGVVRSTYLINPEGKIASIWTGVSVKGHVEEVESFSWML